MGKVLKAAAAAAVMALAAIGVHDVRVHPCSRYSFQAAARVVGWFDDELAYRLRGASTEQSLELFRVSDAGQVMLPPTLRTDVWSNVQSGCVVLVPTRSLAIVAPPWMWQGDAAEFFSEFARVNDARVAGDAQRRTPEFLVFQEGGGVEGLRWQLVATRDAVVELWGPVSPGASTLGTARPVDVEASRVDRWFSLAKEARLAKSSIVHGQCDVLDGHVLSISHFDGKSLGRSHYVNSRQPLASERELAEEFYAFVRRFQMAS